MGRLIVDSRDQAFVLYEMFNIEELCATDLYRDFSRDMFDMTIDLAARIAEEVILPTNAEGDRTGARLENGNVTVPPCYHDAHRKMVDAGLLTMGVSPEAGGQGFPYILECATREYFVHNMGFFLYPSAVLGAAHMIEVFGTEEQKNKYMHRMYAQEWGGTMVLTESEAGSDVGGLRTKAVKQPDGSYRISGSKIFISGGDSDLFSNIVHPVLARIEGDPEGTSGISIFLVPKYMVNPDGTLGRRNDYSVINIEHKMGLKGNATCAMTFGENGNCYGELLGQERQGMKIMFQMMNESRIGMGLQGVGTASIAYLHALNYARERVQSKDIKDMANSAAKSVEIIKHPDVRRMLLWMKSHVEGMRALVYLCALAIDRKNAMKGDESERWHGIMELLIPICKAFNSDMGFRVCEQAVQVYGGYGYCNDYPVEQFLRDLKIASIYEGTNGIQALDLVGRKLGQNKGANLMSFLSEMNTTIKIYGNNETLKSISDDVRKAVDLLAEMAMFYTQCGKEGRFMVPIATAYPFLHMMGTICLAWLLFWQAGISQEKLEQILGSKGIDKADRKALRSLLQNDKEAAFYHGKVMSATFYIRNVLPSAHSFAQAIKNEDMSILEIVDESFAS